jgi:hypothetical protein
MNIRKLINLFSIILFAFALTNIDWFFAIEPSQITDRQNYHLHVVNAENFFLRSYSIGFPLVLFFEPLYYFIIYIFSLSNLNPEFIIKFIIFLIILITTRLIQNKTKISIYWIILMSLTPILIANFVMTIRQGLAMTFFLYGYFQYKEWKRILFILLSPLIHYLFYIVIILYFISNKLIKKNNFNVNKIITITLITSSIISIIIFKIINFIGLAKLESYVDDNQSGIIGFGLVFWFAILILFMLEGKLFLKNNIFPVMLISFYLGTVLFFAPFSRVLQATSPIVLMTGFKLTNYRNYIYKIMIILFVLYIIIIFIYTKSLGPMSIN